MKTATILKRPNEYQILVKLDPPFNNWDYEDNVPHVSLAIISCGRAHGSNETYAFRADEEGQIIDWSELSMSRKGYRNHYRMLQESGYTLLPEGL